jgi:hypothetical protein
MTKQKKTPTSFAEPNRGNKDGSVEDNRIQLVSYNNSVTGTTPGNPCLETALPYSEPNWKSQLIQVGVRL